ncbi:hypothetical protein CDD80_5345 [Ophiocordyceps camponoti-rufipedis]|uniref:Uncharacterized protein n=1 Tax=Ophiocordyceps camponoti-rufipedis TaxID=2004952 RepID=A0A2C5XZS2_9HYPO|nr:hypothetical protein CDD80_5345 [Ophiocordyceps camponoti-rufipedis]
METPSVGILSTTLRTLESYVVLGRKTAHRLAPVCGCLRLGRPRAGPCTSSVIPSTFNLEPPAFSSALAIQSALTVGIESRNTYFTSWSPLHTSSFSPASSTALLSLHVSATAEPRAFLRRRPDTTR